MYGMSYDDYWYGTDETLFWAYAEAHNIKVEEKRDYDNQIAWLSGLYVMRAIGSAFTSEPYPIAIDFEEMDRKNNQSEEEKLKEEQQLIIDNSHSQMMRVMASIKRNKEESG